MAHPQITRAQIEGIEFTLHFDYDQLRDRKLSRLSDEGKVEWFRLRMDYVFLTPLTSLYNGRTPAYRALNSMKQDDLPARSFVIATFSVLLNGIEALGSFMTATKARKRQNVFAFMSTYMPQWDMAKKGDVKELLWEHFRNGIAHGFCIEHGGIDNEADQTRWIELPESLHIGPNVFFKDFSKGVKRFFRDLKTVRQSREVFLRRFQRVYPH